MHDVPPTFGQLWKGFFSSNKNPPMNRAPLPQTAPLVGAPKNATADLLRQARQKIVKGQNRKLVRNQLLASTARKPAAVVAPPAASQASPAPSAGFGGAGYSGRTASRIGDASNPGSTTVAAAPAPPPTPAPAPLKPLM